MSADKPLNDRQANASKSGGKAGRRSVRSKRRKQSDGGEARDLRTQPASQKATDKAQRERRERRRRRRLKAKQQRGLGEAQPEVMTPDPDLDLPPKKVFIYTHIIRPAARDSYEFRSEHFSKITRRLEDFKIDLSPLFRNEEEEARRVQEEIAEGLAGELAGELDESLDEEWEDEDAAWDDEAEEPAPQRPTPGPSKPPRRRGRRTIIRRRDPELMDQESEDEGGIEDEPAAEVDEDGDMYDSDEYGEVYGDMDDAEDGGYDDSGYDDAEDEDIEA